MTNTDHKFGIQPRGPDVNPDGPWWGARAIFEADGRGGFAFSLVWNRQQCTGGGPTARGGLENWINTHGLAALRADIKRMGLQPNDRVLLEVRDEKAGYYIAADPRASHGYLYIGAAALKAVTS
jgi:hypothetical protein